MKKTLLLFSIALFCFRLNVLSQTAGCGSVCKNPSFENGTGSWDYAVGNACTQPDPCVLVNGFDPTQHIYKTTGAYDVLIGGTVLPVVRPGGGNHSMMLGDSNVVDAFAARASYSFDVTSSSQQFIYSYAVVIQNPLVGHTVPEQPYFGIKVIDQSANVITSKKIYWNSPNMLAFGTDMYYLNWTTDTVQLSNYIGQCVKFVFTSSDCSQGGHFGYGYVDATCDSLLSGVIPEIADMNFNIYPNPNAGTFIITTNAGSADYSIEIYNVLGALVFEDKSDLIKYVFNKEILESGVYFVKLINESGASSTQKIVIR